MLIVLSLALLLYCHCFRSLHSVLLRFACVLSCAQSLSHSFACPKLMELFSEHWMRRYLPISFDSGSDRRRRIWPLEIVSRYPALCAALFLIDVFLFYIFPIPSTYVISFLHLSPSLFLSSPFFCFEVLLCIQSLFRLLFCAMYDQ